METLVFGRLSMGETVRDAQLRDVIRIERAGRVVLVLHDAIRLDGDVQTALDRRVIGAGARAVGHD